MPGVDTSIYSNVAKPADPFDTVGKVVGLQNAFTNQQRSQIALQNDRLGLQGNQGVAATYNDPSILSPDGTVNVPAANALLVKNRAGIAAPGMLTTNTGLAGGQISNDTNNSSLIQLQKNQAISAANAAAAEPGATRASILAPVTSMLHSGHISPKTYNEIVSGMPTGDKEAVKHVKTQAAGMVPAGDQAAPAVSGYDPTTLQPTVKTGADVAAAARQPAGTVLAPPPGATEVAAKDQGALYEDKLKSAGILRNTQAPMQALPLIEQLSHGDFGPGSPEYAKLRGLAITVGAIDPNSTNLPAREMAQKYLNQYITGSPHASDMGLTQDKISKPNFDITQPANMHLVKTAIGMDRMDAALPQAATFDRKPGLPYADYKSGFYQTNDPRAFSWDIMSPEERRDVIQSLGSQDSPAYKKFKHSYEIATKTKMITPGGAAQ